MALMQSHAKQLFIKSFLLITASHSEVHCTAQSLCSLTHILYLRREQDTILSEIFRTVFFHGLHIPDILRFPQDLSTGGLQEPSRAPQVPMSAVRAASLARATGSVRTVQKRGRSFLATILCAVANGGPNSLILPGPNPKSFDACQWMSYH